MFLGMIGNLKKKGRTGSDGGFLGLKRNKMAGSNSIAAKIKRRLDKEKAKKETAGDKKYLEWTGRKPSRLGDT